MIIHVTCNTDDNYVQHCCAMLCSLFENNKAEVFHVHILTHQLLDNHCFFLQKLSARYGNECTIHEVEESKLRGVKFRKNRPLTMAAYYRILLPEIIDDDIDKILYLDCDLVVLGNIRELYETNIEGFAVAACSDASPYNDLHRQQLNLSLNEEAFCSGILLVNLKYWRIHDATTKLLEYSQREKKEIFLHDQDSLNYVFRSQWLKLPYKWGVTPMSVCPMDNDQRDFDRFEYAFSPKIIHYAAALKPWKNLWFPDKKYYIRYLYESGFENPNFTEVSLKYKLSTYKDIIRYYISKYVFPFIPDILMIPCRDVIFLLRLFIASVSHPAKAKRLMLQRWLQKHR